jgi:hypothetical protein
MGDTSPKNIEDLYAIDLLMNIPDKKKKKDSPTSPLNDTSQQPYLDEFRLLMKQRIEGFQAINKQSDPIDQYLYAIWLYYVHGNK